MNRFIINLRTLDTSAMGSSEEQCFSRFSMPHFRVPNSILGNIGQPLEYGNAGMDDGEEQDNGVDFAQPWTSDVPAVVEASNAETSIIRGSNAHNNATLC